MQKTIIAIAMYCIYFNNMFFLIYVNNRYNQHSRQFIGSHPPHLSPFLLYYSIFMTCLDACILCTCIYIGMHTWPA